MTTQTIDLGMGCFWKPQKLFDSVNGIVESYVGYTGKDRSNMNAPTPTYKTVCDGDGHIEAVRIVFDDEKISFNEVLDIFFNNQDAESMKSNFKSQYSSAIFTNTPIQAEIVKSKLQELVSRNDDRAQYVVFNSRTDFYVAENYHQKYEKKQPLKLAFLAAIVVTNVLPGLPSEVYKAAAVSTVVFILFNLYELYFDNTGKVDGKLRKI